MDEHFIINEAALAIHTLQHSTADFAVTTGDQYDEAFWQKTNGDMLQKLRFDEVAVPHQVDMTYATGKSWITSLLFTDGGTPTTFGMTHDLRGNTTSNAHLALGEMRYNAFSDQPVVMSVGNSPANYQQYRYDQQGQRTVQADMLQNGDANYYIGHVVLDATGRPKRYTLTDGFALLDQEGAVQRYYTVTDHLGTPRG